MSRKTLQEPLSGVSFFNIFRVTSISFFVKSFKIGKEIITEQQLLQQTYIKQIREESNFITMTNIKLEYRNKIKRYQKIDAANDPSSRCY